MVGEKIGQLSKTMMFLNMLVSHIHVFFFSKYSIFKERDDDANLCTCFFTWSLVLDLQIPIISLRTLP